MGSVERIDETDARILELLQRDGRESYAEVGQTVGMSGPSAHERVKKLEARGVIRGYSALVDPTLLGYGVLAFIFIKQVPGTIATDLTGDFAEIDEIEECHHIAGEADYLLKVRATDTRHLERLLHRIQAVPHVFTTETQVVFSSAFERRPLRLGRELDGATPGYVYAGSSPANGAAGYVASAGNGHHSGNGATGKSGS